MRNENKNMKKLYYHMSAIFDKKAALKRLLYFLTEIKCKNAKFTHVHA